MHDGVTSCSVFQFFHPLVKNFSILSLVEWERDTNLRLNSRLHIEEFIIIPELYLIDGISGQKALILSNKHPAFAFTCLSSILGPYN